MARFTKNPTCHTTHDEIKTQVQKFLNSDSQIEPPEEQTQRLLSSGHLVQVYKEITSGSDKRKLVEKLDQLIRHDDVAVASGGLANVFKREYQGTLVAVKVFRVFPPQHLDEANKILWRTVPIWIKLSHPNVAKFRGVTMIQARTGCRLGGAQLPHPNPRRKRKRWWFCMN